MKVIEKIIKEALKEDIKNGDITTEVFIDKKAIFKGRIKSKEEAVICGIDFAEMCFKILNPKAKIKKLKKDGQKIKSNEIIMEIISDRTILSAERTALNILQRLSGISTKANYFCELAKPYEVEIFDTRKTTPTLRIMEKYAVRCGGAKNHRFGLFDAFMIKDNHISSLKIEELKQRIKKARTLYPNKEIEIEAQNLKQLKSFINLDIDVIMLDNFKVDVAKKAIDIIRKRRRDILVEISGGINEKNIKQYLQLKPDRISIGALTHSYKSIDISLEIERIK